jgi:hypothetical protein
MIDRGFSIKLKATVRAACKSSANAGTLNAVLRLQSVNRRPATANGGRVRTQRRIVANPA